MKNKSLFTSVALLVAVYHGILGAMGTFASPELAASVIQMTYGVSLEFGTQTLYLIKFISAYMLAFALVMYMLSKDPIKYRHLVWVPITLFSVRIFDRLFFFDMLNSGFGMTIQRDLITVAIIGAIALVLYIYRPKSG